jgi:hypothetical protein
MHTAEIYKAGGLIEAESLMAALWEADIESQLDGQPSGIMPGLASSWSMAPVGVLVNAADVERAQIAFVEWQASLPARGDEPAPFRPRYSLQTLFVVMTVVAVMCGIAYHVGQQWIWLIIAAAGELWPTALMVAGYLKKRRRQSIDTGENAAGA